MSDADPHSTAIHELDPQTVERIAAGEVVERPASAVKELVENALDADASRVSVTVEAGGTELIRVADDGVGMTESQVRTAVQPHTTSKISDIDDLESGVQTLGFRGEALHAIGAVSRLTIRTRPRGGDRGTELVVEGGAVESVSTAGCPEGTTVEVRDLFYNVPARRKYLKQEATEFGHVNGVVSGYALAQPDVAVSLSHGDRETFATTGGGELREAVLAVYGRDVADSMVPVEPGELPDGPLTGISGLVSHPETTRASPEYVNTFVNGRYVTARRIREAIVDAYDRQLATGRYPFAALFCQVDPAAIDVNVHPRKLEVRFADDVGLQEQVVAAVSAALMRDGLLRSGAPRGRSAPDQTTIEPGDVAEGSIGGSSPDRGAAHGADRGGEIDASDADATRDQRGPRSSRAAAGTDPHEARRKFHGMTEQHRLDGDPVPDEAAYDRLPAMRILGQVHDTYVVAETGDGLVLIDQHAADERINYERLRGQFHDGIESQSLADPVTVELTAGEAAVATDRVEALEELGFHAEPVDAQSLRVTAVPTLVSGAADPDRLRDVLGDMLAGAEPAATLEAVTDDLLADLACYPSITGNTSLTDGSVRDLLTRLDDCENPWACPHGRPVVIEVAADEIEARFERDYPGHAG